MHPQNAKPVDSVAQQVEHNTFNVGVLGSSPSRVTKKERLEKASLFVFMRYLASFLHNEVFEMRKDLGCSVRFKNHDTGFGIVPLSVILGIVSWTRLRADIKQ